MLGRISFSFLLFLSLAINAFSIDLFIKIVASDPPTEVLINREGSMMSEALIKDQSNSLYKTDIHPTIVGGNAGNLIDSYCLTACWAAPRECKEQVYLGFRHFPPSSITIRIYHRTEEPNAATLSVINSLGTDFDSTLEKYYRARAFHRYWRYVFRMQNHVIAIQSARIWFDATHRLVQMRDSIFREDEEINLIISEYEALARQDSHIMNRLRTYFPPGYAQGIINQSKALNFKFVGEIPDLISKGDLKQASELNRIALESLSSEPEEVQEIILHIQRIDCQLLKNNAAYIDSLIYAKSQSHDGFK